MVEGSDRKVAAAALIRIGAIYEKLDAGRAREVYEHVLREFSDQTEAHRQAQARASRMGAAADGSIVMRKLWTDAVGNFFYSGISPEGRFLTYAGDNNSRLVRRDLTTGAEQALTIENTTGGTVASAVSKDQGKIQLNPAGRQLALVTGRYPALEVSALENILPAIKTGR